MIPSLKTVCTYPPLVGGAVVELEALKLQQEQLAGRH